MQHLPVADADDDIPGQPQSRVVGVVLVALRSRVVGTVDLKDEPPPINRSTRCPSSQICCRRGRRIHLSRGITNVSSPESDQTEHSARMRRAAIGRGISPSDSLVTSCCLSADSQMASAASAGWHIATLTSTFSMGSSSTPGGTRDDRCAPMRHGVLGADGSGMGMRGDVRAVFPQHPQAGTTRLSHTREDHPVLRGGNEIRISVRQRDPALARSGQHTVANCGSQRLVGDAVLPRPRGTNDASL